MSEVGFDFTSGQMIAYMEDYVKNFLYIQSHKIQLDVIIFPIYGDILETKEDVKVIIQAAGLVPISDSQNNNFRDQIVYLAENDFKGAALIGFGAISCNEKSYTDLGRLISLVEEYLGEGQGIIVIKDGRSIDMKVFACLPDGVREITQMYVYYSRQSLMKNYLKRLVGLGDTDKEKEQLCIECKANQEVKIDTSAPKKEIKLKRALIICATLVIIAGISLWYYGRYYGAGYRELRTSLRQFTMYKLGG